MNAHVYFVGNEAPVLFGVDEDRGSEDEGDFRDIFFSLETLVEPHERLYFEDSDGEDVFLRAGDLALIELPLWVVDRDARERLDLVVEDDADDVEDVSSGAPVPSA